MKTKLTADSLFRKVAMSNLSFVPHSWIEDGLMTPCSWNTRPNLAHEVFWLKKSTGKKRGHYIWFLPSSPTRTQFSTSSEIKRKKWCFLHSQSFTRQSQCWLAIKVARMNISQNLTPIMLNAGKVQCKTVAHRFFDCQLAQRCWRYI